MKGKNKEEKDIDIEGVGMNSKDPPRGCWSQEQREGSVMLCLGQGFSRLSG